MFGTIKHRICDSEIKLDGWQFYWSHFITISRISLRVANIERKPWSFAQLDCRFEAVSPLGVAFFVRLLDSSKHVKKKRHLVKTFFVFKLSVFASAFVELGQPYSLRWNVYILIFQLIWGSNIKDTIILVIVMEFHVITK